MTGAEIVEAHATDALEIQFVGRQGGLGGTAFADDVNSGDWRTWSYEVTSNDPVGNPNWFPVSEFISRTAAESSSDADRTG